MNNEFLLKGFPFFINFISSGFVLERLYPIDSQSFNKKQLSKLCSFFKSSAFILKSLLVIDIEPFIIGPATETTIDLIEPFFKRSLRRLSNPLRVSKFSLFESKISDEFLFA